MKNKIKKILFSGILSLVLVFAFAFASLNVLRTDDRAHAADVSYHFNGPLNGENGEIAINIDIVLDVEVTIAEAKVELSKAIEEANQTIAVTSLTFENPNESDPLNTVVGYDSTWGNLVIFEGTYGPKTTNQNNNQQEEVIEYMSSYTTPTKWIEITPVANFNPGVEEVYIANSDSTTAPEVTAPTYPDAHRYVIDGMAVNNQQATLPTFAMDYTVTANDGINSILLIPEFERDFFEIAAVKVYNTVAGWDAATITYNGYDKILLEGENLFASESDEDETVTLFRIYFKTKAYQVERNNETVSITGEHTFGLRVQKTEAQYYAHNYYTESYQWLEGTKLGQQEEVGVRVVYTEASKVNFFVRLTPVLEAPESNIFTYGFKAVSTQKVGTAVTDLPAQQADDLVVKYVYSGNGDVTFAWSSTTAPINASETAYTLTITAAPTFEYYGATREVSVKINQKALEFVIVGGERTYAMPYQPIQKVAQQPEEPTPFTYTLSGVCTGDDAGDSVAIDLGNNTFAYDPEQGSFQAAGTYPLKAHVTNANYSFTQNEATYKINKIKITIVGENQQLTFANRDFEVADLPHHPLVDYAGYDAQEPVLQGFTAKFTESVYVGENALYEANANIPLEMVKEIGIELQKPVNAEWKNVLASGSYEVLVVPTSHDNYDLTVTNGSLTILTVMEENPAAQFIASFFEGKDVYYNAEEQDLLNVKATGLNDAAFPAWLTNVYPEEGEPTIRWDVENNLHTHTGEDGATANNDEEYVMTIRTELNYQDALNYTQGQQVFVFNVTGYLRKLHITLTANDTTSVYGDYIAEEVPNNNVNYLYTVSATPVSVEPLENRDSDVHKLYEADVTRVNNRLTFTNGAVAAALALAEEEEDEYGTYGEGANVGSYTLALTASELSSLTDYVITVANGEHTVTKAPVKYVDPQAEEPVVAEASAEGSGVKITALPAEVYYNRSLQLTTLGTVKVGDLVLAPNKYDIHLEYNNHSYNQADFPWNVGDYVFVVVTLQTSSNYFGASKSATFRVNSIALAQPVVSYNKNEVTWSAVTMDAGVPGEEEYEVAPVALHNATLVYTVYEGEEAHVITPDTNGVYHYLADSTDALRIEVHSSNNANYTDSTLDLLAVHSVTYDDGSHENNTDPDELTGMPGVEYLFHGEKATEPEDPELVGYEFLGWWLHVELEDEPEEPILPYDFNTEVLGNIQLDANWEEILYTVTVRYRDAHGVLQTETTQTAHYNQLISATDVGNLVKFVEQGEQENTYYIPETFRFESKAAAVANGFTEADFGNIYGFHTWKYTDELNAVHAGTSVANALATLVKGDCSFDAEYTEDDHDAFNIRYHVAVFVFNGSPENATYAEFAANENYNWVLPQVQSVKYKSPIQYAELYDNVAWLVCDTWFLDEARLVSAQFEMPTMVNEADGVDVYGAYVFDIGNGDVNASTTVTTDDITVYRQWIVGGYDIEVVEKERVYSSLYNYDSGKTYFHKLVADVNGDNSLDIRDVSTIRMTLVQGYGWDKEEGYNVSGNEVIRNVKTDVFADISTALQAGKKVTLSNNVTSGSALVVSYAGNVTLDLGGHTLDLAKLDLRISNRGTLTIKNGTIITRGTGAELYDGGITLYAPYGNVVLEDVDCWDAQGLVNLGAGSHSLHLFGVVEFYQGTNTAVAEPTPAAVKVAKDTHVVIEPAAELVVEKLVVAKVETTAEVVEFTVPTLPEEVTEEYTITVESKSVEVDINEITVVGHVETNDKIKTFEELVAAGQKGGIYTLEADLDLTAQVVVSKALVLDLNGHKLSNTTDIWHGDDWSLISVQGGNLTIKGNGTLDAKENDCYAVDVRDGANLVIENGTFVGNITAVYAYEGTVTINGGHFSIKQLANNVNTDKYRYTLNLYDANRVAGTATIVVNGGEFEHFNPSNNLAEGPKTNFVAAGYVVSASNDVYTVTTGNAIASVNDLVAAISSNGGNYVLMADVVFGGQASFANDTTINLNGYKLQSTNNTALSAVDGATLTLNGDGEVEAQEFCAIALKGSHLVINGGTYTSHDNAVFGTNGTVNAQQGDYGHNTITINGGVFNGGIQTSGYVACGIYVANSDTVEVKAGTFNIANGVGILARSGNTTVANGVVFNVTGNGTTGKVGDSAVTVPSGEALVVDYAADYPGGDPTLTNNTTYKVAYVVGSKADINAVKANTETIVLGKDIEYAGQLVFAKDVVLNLNGKTLNSTNDSALVVIGTGVTLTVNGNGYVQAQEVCVLVLDGAEAVINGGIYTARDNFVLGTNGSTGRGGNKITVNAGTFNGGIQTAGYVACGIYVANNDTVVVNAGTFNVTNGVGILARSGNTTVANGVVLNVTGNSETLGKVGDSRVVLPAGSKLVLDFVANYPGGDPTLTNNTSYDVTTIYNNQAVSALVINNLAQLKAFRDDVNAGNNYDGKIVVLNADITLDEAWVAISNYSRKDSANESKWFAGTFDGRGHVISGLTNNSANIVEKEEFTYGLFGSVKNAVIKNLTLEDVNISTDKGDSLGALVGYYAGSTQKAEANISNITVSGTVAGADNVGGVVGRAAGDYFKAENVTVNGTVTALKKAAGVVGTGNAHEMVFVKCVNHAKVSSTESDSNQGYNTVAGISITWKGQDDQHPVCTKVVLTNCSNDGVLSTCNTSSLAGQLAVDYSPQTQLNLNGTWTYANGQWTRQ